MVAGGCASDDRVHMKRNPFQDFHRGAEAAGYPALLLVTVVCLAIMVASITLLAVTQAAWALALAVLNLVLAVAILSGGIGAAFSDSGRSPRGDEASRPASAEHQATVPLPRRHREHRGPGRRAA
jgi:hypothetical protein